MSTDLLASHLKAAEVVGLFIEVVALDFFEEAEGVNNGARTQAYVLEWKSGGGLIFGRNDAVVHTLLLAGMRRADAVLLCDKNVGRAEARAFHVLAGAPTWLVAAERAQADMARTRWGERGLGAQLETL